MELHGADVFVFEYGDEFLAVMASSDRWRFRSTGGERGGVGVGEIKIISIGNAFEERGFRRELQSVPSHVREFGGGWKFFDLAGENLQAG